MKHRVKIHLVNGAIWLLIGSYFAYHMFGGTGIPREYRSMFASAPKEEGAAQITAYKDDDKERSGVLPEKVVNQTPFVSQAPFANWDAVHEETCEEAAIVMAHFFRQNKKELSADEAERELMAMVNYQEEKYGGARDINVEEISKLASDFYGETGYNIVKNYSLSDLKQYLADGNIIIVPAAGRVLENPNFKQPGPLYHALVLTGYDENKQQFISNDPGTRKGENFRYSYKNMLESIHDFPGEKEQILTGEKAVIVVGK